MAEATGAAPRNTSQFFELPKVDPKVVNVYCGGAGANAAQDVINQLDPEEFPHQHMVVIDSNSGVLADHFSRKEDPNDPYAVNLFKWFDRSQLTILPIGKGFGAGGDPKEGEKIFREKLDAIKAIFENSNLVVQVGGAGGGTASGVMPIIAETLQGMEIPTYSVLASPRLNEGEMKIARALHTQQRLHELCPTTVVHNERIQLEGDKDRQLSEIYREIDKACLYPVLRQIRQLSQETGDVQDLDPTDLKNYLAVGNYVLPGYFNASNGLEGIEEALLGNKYLDTRIMAKAIRVMFLFRGAWTYGEQDRVKDFVCSKMNKTLKDKDVESKSGVKERGIPVGEKTVGFMAFAKEGPDGGIEDEAQRSMIAVPRLPIASSESTAEDASTPEVTLPGIPASSNGHGEVEGPKMEIRGDVYGNQTKVMISEKLAKQFNALFTLSPSATNNAHALEVQARIEEETGLHFTVPVIGTHQSLGKQETKEIVLQ